MVEDNSSSAVIEPQEVQIPEEPAAPAEIKGTEPHYNLDGFLASTKVVLAYDNLIIGKFMGQEDGWISRLDDLDLNSLIKLSDLLVETLNTPKRMQDLDALSNKFITKRIVESDEPENYVWLQDPDMLSLVRQLSRVGLLHEVVQKRVDKARATRYQRSVADKPEGQIAAGGIETALNEASRATDLISFNHAIRDLVDSKAGRYINIGREEMVKIATLLLRNDKEHAVEIEAGIAVEIATMKALKARFTDNPAMVRFGTVEEDRKGGDVIINGSIKVDLKKSPPETIRQKISREAAQVSGFFKEKPGKFCLWLGDHLTIGQHYSVPSEYKQTIDQLVAAAQVA